MAKRLKKKYYSTSLLFNFHHDETFFVPPAIFSDMRLDLRRAVRLGAELTLLSSLSTLFARALLFRFLSPPSEWTERAPTSVRVWAFPAFSRKLSRLLLMDDLFCWCSLVWLRRLKYDFFLDGVAVRDNIGLTAPPSSSFFSFVGSPLN